MFANPPNRNSLITLTIVVPSGPSPVTPLGFNRVSVRITLFVIVSVVTWCLKYTFSTPSKCRSANNSKASSTLSRHCS